MTVAGRNCVFCARLNVFRSYFMRLCLRRRLGCHPKLGPLHTALLCLFHGCHIRLQLQMMSKVSA